MKVRDRSSATTRSVTTAPCPSLSGRLSIPHARDGADRSIWPLLSRSYGPVQPLPGESAGRRLVLNRLFGRVALRGLCQRILGILVEGITVAGAVLAGIRGLALLERGVAAAAHTRRVGRAEFSGRGHRCRKRDKSQRTQRRRCRQ